MLNIYVIGCGGIGGYIAELLPMALASMSLDKLPKQELQQALENAGNVAIPCCADRLVFVDGDTFNPRNAIRQGNGAGTKLQMRLRQIENSILRKSYLRNLDIYGINAYVSPRNIEEIIPRNTPPLNGSYSASSQWCRVATTSVIFLCVDNLKTRYEVSKYAETLDDVLVINGGNMKTTGQVTVYERSHGDALDPNIYEVFPEVTADADKRPDEMGCEIVAPKHDQIAITNSMVASAMLAVFNRWYEDGLTVSTKSGATRRINEVLIDMRNLTMTHLYHPLNKPTERKEQK